MATASFLRDNGVSFRGGIPSNLSELVHLRPAPPPSLSVNTLDQGGCLSTDSTHRNVNQRKAHRFTETYGFSAANPSQFAAVAGVIALSPDDLAKLMARKNGGAGGGAGATGSDFLSLAGSVGDSGWPSVVKGREHGQRDFAFR